MNSFDAPFVFDGKGAIENNQSIRSLFPLGKFLHGTSRPIVKFSFALNYAIHRLNLKGFHLVNLAIHFLAALVLLGIIRRTLLSRKIPLFPRYYRKGIAFSTALLWAIHPLQTESVTYIFQRSESLMGLFYLLTIYAIIRGMNGGGIQRWWFFLACFFCTAGMGCKPVMITAPITVLVYDRIFWAYSWGEIWEKRRYVYLGLALSWIVLILINVGQNESSSTVGRGLRSVTSLSYAAVQPASILHYIKLSFWPDKFVLDYGWSFARSISASIFPALTIFSLIGISVWLLFRSPRIGFLCFWFFFLLVPTSSFFPLADPVVEHRMYLPLASVVLGTVLSVVFFVRKVVKKSRLRFAIFMVLLVAVSLALGVRTIYRNAKYRSRLSIWEDVVAKCPRNPRGHANLAGCLVDSGEIEKAIAHSNMALYGPKGRLKVLGDAAARIHYNLALVLEQYGDRERAMRHYQEAITIMPSYIDAYNNLAMLLVDLGYVQDAYEYLINVIKKYPYDARLYVNLGIILESLGREEEALEQYQKALMINPGCSQAYNNLGVFFASRGDLGKAGIYFEKAYILSPEDSVINQNLLELKDK
ncbi:MAG TPA: tetratricopeptide repeat protein [Candidatus Omnitrophota bacterium]|nr:tetratricopeptide repeat protein [Candidatus Omnitrophota bacterium]